MRASSDQAAKRLVLWFRNDLRLDDNVIVGEALRRVQSGMAQEVVPVYTFDPRWFKATKWGNGFLKTGPYRAQFLLESVLDLKHRLRGIGSDLVIALGAPEVTLASLSAGAQTVVLAQAEVTSEEIQAETAVGRALKRVPGASLELHWGLTLFHRDDLPFNQDLSNMPDVFTPFRTKCEERVEVRKCIPVPKPGSLPLPLPNSGVDKALFAFTPSTIEDINPVVPQGHPVLQSPSVDDKKTAFTVKGGETEALARLRYFLWDTNLVAKYFDIRNGMLGADYSTKLAASLAHGCISPRRIYWEIQRYESERQANKSTYWVIFELIWRDYFKFYALKHGDSIFHKTGPVGRRGALWNGSTENFLAWKEGRTGWPLVDANMRELSATGFMSNRGRQNVASFLALDLGVDWRKGADWFESMLVDYDPASNWGNWVAAAGLTGGRVNKFNIVKQSKDYDQQGDYIRHWCPELKNVPSTKIHEPWLMSREEQKLYNVTIGVDYPQALPTSSFAGRQGGTSKSFSRFSNGSGKGRGGRGFRNASAYDMYG